MLLQVCSIELTDFLSWPLVASLLCHQFFSGRRRHLFTLLQENWTKQRVGLLVGLFLGKEIRLDKAQYDRDHGPGNFCRVL